MACESVSDWVITETNRYLPDVILNRLFTTSPIFTLMPRGMFPKGIGNQINIPTFQPRAPIGLNGSWRTVPSANLPLEGGSCLGPAHKVTFGHIVRNFNRQELILEGPDFCAKDLNGPYALTEQLSALINILINYTRLVWEDRDRQEYFRLVGHKVVVTGCGRGFYLQEEADTYPAGVEPSTTLSLGNLQAWKDHLIRDAATETTMFFNNGSPLMTVISDTETIGHLIRDNTELRDDIRWADAGRGNAARLVQAWGINSSYGGFMFIGDTTPRRFNWDGAALVEVAPYEDYDVTSGTGSRISSAYENAEFTETIIHNSGVMTQLIPEPVVRPHPEWVFNPIDYTGPWIAMNIRDRVCNPDGTIIYHRATLEAGSKPVHPERGVAFVHKRCDPECGNLQVCAS